MCWCPFPRYCWVTARVSESYSHKQAMFTHFTRFSEAGGSAYASGESISIARQSSDSTSGFFVIFVCRTPGEEKWATWAPARSTAQHAAGEHLGLASWTRFTPGEKFELCDYLRCFMGHLGHKMKTYQVMDGRKLSTYPCVVVRHKWEELRKSFFEAFRVPRFPGMKLTVRSQKSPKAGRCAQHLPGA